MRTLSPRPSQAYKQDREANRQHGALLGWLSATLGLDDDEEDDALLGRLSATLGPDDDEEDDAARTEMVFKTQTVTEPSLHLGWVLWLQKTAGTGSDAFVTIDPTEPCPRRVVRLQYLVWTKCELKRQELVRPTANWVALPPAWQNTSGGLRTQPRRSLSRSA
ncbi:hypothetical protein AYL99_11836 [Fonsecaea erecta]|uniref:Uncharacterized protein n=1 Tax=Fonsecaea erecta TaxID=1367422 RepID=A0A178Z3E1_9EURO|nr:hypothetical protein AYL99_11836 [Fonsecaea erecta]OAP53956.1 hypothetical protein AYL99_11836 [Fonsecaea erecta]